jgi:pimeloyl-ACP methyl ester carboxylesterase
MRDVTMTRLAGSRDALEVMVVGPSLGTVVETLWGRAAELLGERLEVVGWDLPGHGRSGPVHGPVTTAELADLVRGHADRLAAGRPASYVGLSFAGLVGFELALDPGPFRAVAAVASAPRIGDRESWLDRADMVRRTSTSALVGPSSLRWFAPGFVASEPATAAALLEDLLTIDDESYACLCDTLAGTDLRPQLADGTKIPVLVAVGTDDVVLDVAAVREMTSTVPGVVFVELAGRGHLPPAEDPAAVATLLTRFLAEVSR